MANDDLAYTPASELAAAYRAGGFSPVEATEAALARIEAYNGRLNAFYLVDSDGALAAARESEARWQAGEPEGPIDGVPVSIKDHILTKGWPSPKGSRSTDPDQPWDEDAPAVARLREAGAVLLGKTTMPEFGWKGVTESARFGVTRNPWNLDKTPGGSSGGAAAALGAGMGPLALGSDGGGSIRIPAGFTGLVGFKATFGRVPVYPPSPFATLSHVGPMARTVRDTALLLSVIARPDARDWFALPPEGTDYTAELDEGVAGLRIAFSPALGFANVDPEVAALVEAAAYAFADLGASVEAVDPGFDDPTPVFDMHWTVGCANALSTMSPEQRAQIEPDLLEQAESGEATSTLEYLAAMNTRAALGLHMNRFHQDWDLLLTPSLAVPAFDTGRIVPPGYEGPEWLPWTPFTYPFNLTQQPALSVPCGFTAEGLPVGLQIVGAKYADALVLRAGRAYEAAHPTTERRPEL